MGYDNRHARNIRDTELKRRETLRIARPDRETEMLKLEKCSRERVDEILRDQAGSGNPTPEEKSAAGERDGNPRETEGRAMSPRVGEIMSTRIAAISFDDTMMVVKGIFSTVHFHHLPVVDDAGNLIGIVSEHDFLRSVSPFLGTVNEQSRDVELMKKKVGLIMTRNPVAVTVDAGLAEAVALMSDRRVSCLPVVTRGTNLLIGIITWKDIAMAFFTEALL